MSKRTKLILERARNAFNDSNTKDEKCESPGPCSTKSKNLPSLHLNNSSFCANEDENMIVEIPWEKCQYNEQTPIIVEETVDTIISNVTPAREIIPGCEKMHSETMLTNTDDGIPIEYSAVPSLTNVTPTKYFDFSDNGSSDEYVPSSSSDDNSSVSDEDSDYVDKKNRCQKKRCISEATEPEVLNMSPETRNRRV
ncbi:unnamed protein product [Ceutorhynchus assimilis]|uniref:Uncharacterized protein n=1 Tax=Ceutorhynchus assimilis TaxID=467358 RepID=A0A9N9QEN0_9CUCU|nr:unnamed protein product [Ceutorhynchus assimilis]